MFRTQRGLLCLLAIFFISSSSSFAFREPVEISYPENFDLTGTVEASDLVDRRTAIESRMKTAFGSDLNIHWGDTDAYPSLLLRADRPLAQINLDGDPVAAVRNFLKQSTSVFGLSNTEVDALDAAKVYFSESLDTTHVQFLQRVNGISIFRGNVRFNVTQAGEILNIGGGWYPGLQSPTNIELSPEDALFLAAKALGLNGTIPALAQAETTGERKTIWQAGGEYLAKPEARLVHVPLASGEVVTTWEVLIHENTSGLDHLYMTLVDAETGKLWYRQLLTLYMDPSTAVGLVFDCEDPDDCAQTEVSFAGDPVASPSNWVADTHSEGNNVASRTDWNGWNSNDPDNLADGGRKLEFLFTFTNGYANGGSVFSDNDAAITNGFYWGNVIHDHWYHLGFDEAAGNYQSDNFGNGGLGNDRVNVDVQDSASISFVRNNATWSPSLDGTEPRTNYYLWTNPNRDGAFDAGVIWHEFGHGLSTRLVGGPSTQCLSGVQGGGMGEGWGDWLGVHYFSGPSDNPDGPVVVGGYVTGDETDGIRRYPYSVDPAVNPLTYADLCNQGCQVHRDGEIWANALWNVRHDLIEAWGYEEGFSRAEQLVMDGLKLSPCSPNMVSMRDLIYQADEQVYGGENSCILRAAFATKGFGADASSEGTGSNNTADFNTISPADDSMVFASKSDINWNARSDAEGYRVARGDFTGAAGNLFDNASCQGEAATNLWTDATVPTPGNGFFYTIAVRDDCFVSNHGSASNGQERSVVDCP